MPVAVTLPERLANGGFLNVESPSQGHADVGMPGVNVHPCIRIRGQADASAFVLRRRRLRNVEHVYGFTRKQCWRFW